MVSSLPFAACIGASAVFTDAAASGLPVVDFATGFVAGFCVTLGDAAMLLDF